MIVKKTKKQRLTTIETFLEELSDLEDKYDICLKVVDGKLVIECNETGELTYVE
jgi:hypothetical protein